MRDPKEHGKLRQNYIVHIGPIGYRTILVPVSESTTETVDCIQGDSRNPEECVFPFRFDPDGYHSERGVLENYCIKLLFLQFPQLKKTTTRVVSIA